jgi:hypothetical protein
VLTSEPTGGLKLALPRTVVATVEVDDSGMKRRAVGGGEAERDVVLRSDMAGSVGCASCAGSGDRGSIARFSCIEFTTFSRSMGVMCLPRTWLVAESWRPNSGRKEAADRVVAVMAPSEAICESSEPTLVDSSGISSEVASWRLRDHMGGLIWSGWQQNVSRDHSRQARFSYRLPSSIAGEHLAKTTWSIGLAAMFHLAVKSGGGDVYERWQHDSDSKNLCGERLTRPQAKQVLGVGFDGTHCSVLDAHHGHLGVKRHRRSWSTVFAGVAWMDIYLG